MDWPATRQDRLETWERLTRPPFVLDSPVGQTSRRLGLRLLLDWLESQPGATWQDSWLASGAGAAGAAWRQVPAAWLREYDQDVPYSRDAEGLARLRALLATEPDVPGATVNRTLYRAAQILAAKGGTLNDITTGDVLELLEAEAAVHGTGVGGVHLFYRLLRAMGVFGGQAPATLRALRGAGQRSPEELIDRYRLACRPIRDLLVAYLRERQPALDYTSLNSLANILGKLFWADLERHHPGINSLRLPPEVAQAWKQRLRTVTKTIRTPVGGIANDLVRDRRG